MPEPEPLETVEQWKAEVIGAIDPEEFYDFQVNRPVISTDHNGHRRLAWPTTRIAVAFPARPFSRKQSERSGGMNRLAQIEHQPVRPREATSSAAFTRQRLPT